MNARTLLVVDDIQMNRQIVCDIFKSDFDILQAGNGKEAMEIIESTPINIVITDIFMEPVNGYELIKKIRARDEYKKIPVIAITESDNASRRKALKAGADDLVYKPFIATILKNRVKGLLYDGLDLNRYTMAYENNPLPFVVYHVIDRPDTPSYKIMYMNRAARVAYSPPFIENVLQTDEKPAVRDLLLKAIRTGDVQEDAIFEQEINRWLDWTIYPDGSGLVASMIHDITGEINKHTEDANAYAKMAIDERNTISKIVENIPSGIFVFNVSNDDLVVVEANSTGCKLLDVDPVKVIGVHKDVIMSFVHPEDHEAVISALKEAQTPERIVSYTCRIFNRRNNKYVWFSAQAHSKLQSDGNIFAYISYRDITLERELAETKLKLLVTQKADQEKNDFLSRVSHDIRTPLNGIIGVIDGLNEKVTDKSALRDIEQLQMSAQYLSNLIADTLDVSRIQNGNLKLHPTVCDGRTVFNSVLTLAKQSMNVKHLHFVVKADNLPFSYLYLDVERSEQVVMIILANAAKFTPEGGTVTFTMENLSIKDGIITDRITIEDTGVGMSPEFLPHAFEPFSQENNGITSSTNGSGLGLTISKQIVELMGGTIEMESESGEGTKVVIELPLNIATDEQIKEHEELQYMVYDQEDFKEKRILLCEDHPLNATIATRLLQKKGMLVELAVNGEIGVTMFNESPDGYYDAILMDIRMPVMDGLTATKTIRALHRLDATTIPIIALTANVLENDIKLIKEAGMNDYLSKPIDTNKLYETLEKTLQLGRLYNREKILIVDDVDVNRDVLKASLMDEYILLEASNGKEALEILESTNGIDVVITDIQMPEMDGVELIKRMRANPQYRRIAILANTQYGDPAQEEELLDLGASDFIYKPSTPVVVKSRVRSILK